MNSKNRLHYRTEYYGRIVFEWKLSNSSGVITPNKVILIDFKDTRYNDIKSSIENHTLYDLIIEINVIENIQDIPQDEINNIVDSITLGFECYYDYVYLIKKSNSEIRLTICEKTSKNYIKSHGYSLEYNPLNLSYLRSPIINLCDSEILDQFVESLKYDKVQHIIQLCQCQFTLGYDNIYLTNSVGICEDDRSCYVVYSKENHDEIVDFIHHLSIFNKCVVDTETDELNEIEMYLKYLEAIDTSNVKRVN